MKTIVGALCAIMMMALIPAASAAEKVVAGPNGGRLFEVEGTKLEFLVEKDRTVSVRFYDSAMKAVPPKGQVVSAVAEAKDKKRLEFAARDNVMASTAPLPEGNGYNVVLQVRPKADAAPRNFRIRLNLETCGECKLAEYACTCDH